MDSSNYETPVLTDAGDVAEITQGQNGKAHADDSDGSGYWN